MPCDRRAQESELRRAGWNARQQLFSQTVRAAHGGLVEDNGAPLYCHARCFGWYRTDGLIERSEAPRLLAGFAAHSRRKGIAPLQDCVRVNIIRLALPLPAPRLSQLHFRGRSMTGKSLD